MSNSLRRALQSDAARRTIRTFIQAFLGSVLTNGVLSSISTSGLVDWSVLEKAGVSAIAAGVIAAFTLAQNLVEDKTGRALLVPKNTPDPEPTDTPAVAQIVPDPEPVPEPEPELTPRQIAARKAAQTRKRNKAARATQASKRR